MKLFKNKKKFILKDITCGVRDENGFCDIYMNGVKSNVRLLVFSNNEVEKLEKIIK